VFSNPQSLTFGILLTLVGGVWTCGNMGWFDTADVLHRWWPLAFVIWGIVELLGQIPTRARSGMDVGGPS
jgi:hypothetical protein